MRPRTWVLLLAIFGVAAIAVPFLGYSLPFCTGGIDGQVGAECMAEWEAAMPVFPQRFVYVLGRPMSAAVTFLALTAIAIAVYLARRLGRRRGLT